MYYSVMHRCGDACWYSVMHAGVVVLCWGGVGMREVCRCRVMVEGEGCVREGSGGGRVVRCEVGMRVWCIRFVWRWYPPQVS